MKSKHFWAASAIAAMWTAVLFVGVFGPSLEITSAGDTVSVPVLAMTVAFFALIGTVLVAIFGFRG